MMINLLDAFVQVELRKGNGQEYELQGILFRDNSDFGIILPAIKGIEEGLSLITIKSPLYPREFEFTPSPNFLVIRNEYLMFVPIEEIECGGEIKHKTRVYSKEELSSIRYVVKNHFVNNIQWESSYLCTYLMGITKGVVTNGMYNFFGYTSQEDLSQNIRFVNILDAKLYDGSPLIINYSYDKINFYTGIQGIFIKNPESIPSLKELPNTGILVSIDIINDIIRKL